MSNSKIVITRKKFEARVEPLGFTYEVRSPVSFRSQLKMYWNYFKYVLEHKKNVFIECWKEGLYIHAFTHDLSKFSILEFKSYAKKFYGNALQKKI